MRLLIFPQALCSLGPSLMAQTSASESVYHTKITEGAEQDVTLFWAGVTLLGWSNSHNHSDSLLLCCNKKPLFSKCKETDTITLLPKACILAPLMYLSRFLLQPLKNTQQFPWSYCYSLVATAEDTPLALVSQLQAAEGSNPLIMLHLRGFDTAWGDFSFSLLA